MPLYELLCIASKQQNVAKLASLVNTSSALILANGGVIRSIDSWGSRNLPQKMKRGDGSGLLGEYWVMRFDANPPTVAALNERLRLDPRVLRWTTLKVGSKLQEVTALPEDPSVRYNRASLSTEGSRVEPVEDSPVFPTQHLRKNVTF